MRRRADEGMTLIEALAALAILGFALLASTAAIAWTNRIEVRAAQRAVGLELASSLAERLRAAPYSTIESGDVDLSTEYASLPGLAAEIQVTEDEDKRLKHVQVVVSWTGDMPGRVLLPTSVGGVEIYR
jgi:prepilin-type N-terminal cleavage/methylation domain-containing protein